MPILNWLTRDKNIRTTQCVPYSLLEEVPNLSVGEKDTGNMLIQGDNLKALKALLPFYAGRIQCIYIDPPFNTKQAFPKYDDNLEHSIWLEMMYSRIEYIYELLCQEGSMFVHLDDNELDYAKIISDEVFQRKNFVSRITLKARSPSAFSTVNPGVFKASEYLLWYCKNKSFMYQDRIWVPRDPDPAYNKFISNVDDHYKYWKIEPLSPYLKNISQSTNSHKTIQKKVNKFIVQHSKKVVRLAEIDDRGAGQDIVEAKKQSVSLPNKVICHKRNFHEDIYILDGKQILFYSKNIRNIDGELTPARMLTNIWDDISWEGIAKEGNVRFPKAKKPERLIRRCLQLVTKPGDLVLDSFLGSGTTAAVAHKMGRHYIGIEMGEQAKKLCLPRLRNVVSGEQSGISKIVNWHGGGGFRFYRLGPPVFDEEGRIRTDIHFPVLAAHIWFSETDRPWDGNNDSPLLGLHEGCAYALLYNGILGDRSPGGGNVLTRATLALIRDEVAKFHPDFVRLNSNYPITIYGEQSRLMPSTLDREHITFKQTPYDITVRV